MKLPDFLLNSLLSDPRVRGYYYKEKTSKVWRTCSRTDYMKYCKNSFYETKLVE